MISQCLLVDLVSEINFLLRQVDKYVTALENGSQES